jgi:hypothetical protein
MKHVKCATNAWALLEKGRLDPYAFQNRRMVQLQAARGMMGTRTFEAICQKHGVDYRSMDDVTVMSRIRRYWPCISALWREVKRGHPTARLVRVQLVTAP